MIQLNLIPEVKSTFIKTQHTKRLAVLSVSAICGVALTIVIILATITFGAQKVKLNSLGDKIDQSSNRFRSVEGLSKILTIQNQLNSLGSLHSNKPVVGRLFNFLPKITPTDVSISSISIQFQDSTLNISGLAVSFEAVNKFADTLKFTDYTTNTIETNQPAFSSVVLANFAKVTVGSTYTATYTITANFDAGIFSTEYDAVNLSVPKITSTRSQTEQPDALFEEQPEQLPSDNTGTVEP